MKTIVRPAQPADLPAMYAISSRVHLADYYRQLIPASEWKGLTQHYRLSLSAQARFASHFLPYMTDGESHAVVACRHDRVVGYTVATHTAQALELRGLFVDPDFQSMGVGSLLFNTSLQWRRAKEIVRLVVIAQNERAKRLYTAAGFRVIHPAEQLFYGASQDVMEQVSVDIS